MKIVLKNIFRAIIRTSKESYVKKNYNIKKSNKIDKGITKSNRYTRGRYLRTGNRQLCLWRILW